MQESDTQTKPPLSCGMGSARSSYKVQNSLYCIPGQKSATMGSHWEEFYRTDTKGLDSGVQVTHFLNSLLLEFLEMLLNISVLKANID